jgi:hypothetical protein
MVVASIVADTPKIGESYGINSEVTIEAIYTLLAFSNLFLTSSQTDQ